MKIANPKIADLLNGLSTLNTFAAAAAQSAAQDITAPVAVAGPALPVLEELVNAYKADEQADRGALFKAAVAKMEGIVAELKTVEVLIDPPVVEPMQPPAPVTPSAGLPVVEPAPAPVVEPAPAVPAEPLPS